MGAEKHGKLSHEQLMYLKLLHHGGAFNRRKTARDYTNGFLYIIKDNASNRYKIGITTNYKDRLRSLNTIVPFGITIIEIFPSSKYKEIEKDVHERFNNRRRNGEWFEFNENDLKECIDYVKSMTYVDVRCIRE
ncbi:MAG TPA: GIY-YIG nuclease family protein [Virgibacillus sp.]|nr:GIY-YIG nuclease family protein [Virgibacillus sp.]HLR69441.1 GIY-YIG nuclease family protein [Virgibacillus sp.]